MTTQEFNEFFEGRIRGIQELACSKNKEYATRDDHFRNFNQGAQITGSSPQKVLWGFFLKHFISLQDHILHDTSLTPCQVDEKINDMIIYLFLLAGMEVEKRIWDDKMKLINEKQAHIDKLWAEAKKS